MVASDTSSAGTKIKDPTNARFTHLLSPPTTTRIFGRCVVVSWICSGAMEKGVQVLSKISCFLDFRVEAEKKYFARDFQHFCDTLVELFKKSSIFSFVYKNVTKPTKNLEAKRI